MDWLSVENLLSVIVVLLTNQTRQNNTIQKLLKPLGGFFDKYGGTLDKLKEAKKK